jgi:hypothetical protein
MPPLDSQRVLPHVAFALAFAACLGVHATAEEAARSSYYEKARSYSTDPDPDLPRYVKGAAETGIEGWEGIDWLDVGVDYRFRFEYRDDDIRRPVAGLDLPLLHRTRAYLGLHDALDPFRFAVELEDARRANGNFPYDDRDVNEFALIRLQGELYFADWLPADPLGNSRPLSLRYGIQNFEFLDRRLLGNNQWRNTTNTFIGFRGAIGQQANDWQLDLLSVQPLRRDLYGWDRPVEGRRVHGAIGHWRRWSEIATLQPFYLNLTQSENPSTAAREVHAPGLRAYGLFGETGFDFDLAGVKQFGENAARSVDAGAATFELGYTLDAPWKPRISAFHGIATGDADLDDLVDNRFERFYGFARPWSANDYLVFENIRSTQLRLEFAPSKDLRFDLGYGWRELESARDRYLPGAVVDPTGRSGRKLGDEFDFRARWRINERLGAILGYAFFRDGAFVSNAIRPGDTDFAYLELSYSLF